MNCHNFRYSKLGMEMVKLLSMEDWESLPLTPWKIKQPKLKEERENANHSGKKILKNFFIFYHEKFMM